MFKPLYNALGRLVGLWRVDEYPVRAEDVVLLALQAPGWARGVVGPNGFSMSLERTGEVTADTHVPPTVSWDVGTFTARGPGYVAYGYGFGDGHLLLDIYGRSWSIKATITSWKKW